MQIMTTYAIKLAKKTSVQTGRLWSTGRGILNYILRVKVSEKLEQMRSHDSNIAIPNIK